jgi:iron complex outermembrane receptor protein
VYAGNHKVTQYQAFSKAFQAPVVSSGGVVAFDRKFGGINVHWVAVRALGGGSLTTTVGLDYGRSSDDRQGYENFIGSQFGVAGAPRRNETDTVTSLDPYLQANGKPAIGC